MFSLGNEPVGFRSSPSFKNGFQHGANATLNILLPLPNWKTSKLLWKSGWSIHIYGFAFLFLVVSLMSALIGIKFRHRIWRLKTLLYICVLLCVAGMLRLFYLSVDPYGYKHILSPVIVGVLSQLIYPLLCSSYGFIQIMLLRITRLDVGRSKLRNVTPLISVTLVHLFCIVLIEVIVYYEYKAKFLLIIDNGLFIVFALYLCISFISNGFRLSQYGTDIERVRKQLEEFNVTRKTQPMLSISRSSMSLRLAGPQFKITNEDQMTITIATDVASTSSENESASSNVRVRKRRRKRTSTTNHTNHEQFTSPCGTRNDILDSTGFIFSDESGLAGISDSSGVLLDAHSLLYMNTKLDETTSDRTSNRTICEDIESNFSSAQTSQHGGETIHLAENNESLAEENGYLADTEIVINSPKLRFNNHLRTTEDVDSLQHSNDYTALTDNLKCRTSFISLYRIRQGVMLQRVIKLTYFTTFLFLFAILLQLYSVFGVYGVLNSNLQPDPWPWFTFQTLFRLTEVSISFLLMAVLFTVLNYKPTRGRRKQLKIPSRNCVI